MMEQVLDYYVVEYDPTRTGNQSFKCPVHDDRTASASLNLDEGLFHCHACGAGGDGYSLIMQKEGIGFGQAKKFAEEIIGTVSGVGSSSKPPPVSRGSGYQPRYRRKSGSGKMARVSWS